MEVICLEDKIFYLLIEKVVDRIKDKFEKTENEWLSADDALQLLHIASKTTLAVYRNKGFIKFSQISPKIILYSRTSINDFLLNHSQKPF